LSFVSTSQLSGNSTSNSASVIEPHVQIMEDFSVYRGIHIISSDVPSEYLKLEYMLSALLAAKQQKKIENLV